MVNPFEIKSTDTSPEIFFDKEKGLLRISGRSLMEDVVNFYQPALDWIDEYLKTPKNPTIIELEMDYFNSSSARMLAKILIKFEAFVENGNLDVKVIWKYKKNDDIMRERGQEFKTIIYLPFELQEVEA